MMGRFCLLVFLFLMSSTHLHAASGNVVIPHFYTSNSSNLYSFFYLSNISNVPVDVEITFYDKTGAILRGNNDASTGPIRGYEVTNYAEPPVGATATLTIAPNATSRLSLRASLQTAGHGVIKWTQTNSSRRRAMVAQGRVWSQSGSVSQGYAIVINNGKPF